LLISEHRCGAAFDRARRANAGATKTFLVYRTLPGAKTAETRFAAILAAFFPLASTG